MGVVTRDYDVFGAIRRSCDTFARTIIRCFWGGLTDLPLHMWCGIPKCIVQPKYVFWDVGMLIDLAPRRQPRVYRVFGVCPLN